MRTAFVAVLFAVAALPLSAHAADQSVVGEWGGALHGPDGAYRVRLHVQAVAGGLVGTVSGLPFSDAVPLLAHVEKIGDRLSFGTRLGQYSGVWNHDQAQWVGTWKQAGLSEPLALRWDSDNAMRPTRPDAGTAQLPAVVDVPQR
jgi:hypothetical protein